MSKQPRRATGNLFIHQLPLVAVKVGQRVLDSQLQLGWAIDWSCSLEAFEWRWVDRLSNDGPIRSLIGRTLWSNHWFWSRFAKGRRGLSNTLKFMIDYFELGSSRCPICRKAASPQHQ